MVKYPNLIFKTPRNFTDKNLSSFLYSIQDAFCKRYPKDQLVILDVNDTATIDVTCILVLYKFMEYAAFHKLFYTPCIKIDDNCRVQNRLEEYGFDDLFRFVIYNYSSEHSKEYRNLKTKSGENFIIAPKPLLRSEGYTKKDIEEKYYKQIAEYFQFDQRVVVMIFTCLSEVIINFMEHATADKRSIIVALGDKKGIKIACADNGDGIVSTMRSLEKYSKIKDNKSVLKLALQKHVTSKEGTPFHMGCGLWIIDEIVTKSNGQLYIYSEGVKYSNIGGIKKWEDCGNWKGTIISINLTFENPIVPKDIMTIDNEIFK